MSDNKTAAKTAPKNDTEAEPQAPEVTIDTLSEQTAAGLENARAILFKQMGADELIQSLKKEGYKIVKE